jgi:hypothetical protein
MAMAQTLRPGLDLNDGSKKRAKAKTLPEKTERQFWAMAMSQPLRPALGLQEEPQQGASAKILATTELMLALLCWIMEVARMKSDALVLDFVYSIQGRCQRQKILIGTRK